jgi:outer membrane receptor for Fe3+-dicitrate
MIATKSDFSLGYYSLDVPWYEYTGKFQTYYSFKYNHKLKDEKQLNFSVNDIARQKDFWFNLSKYNQKMNGFVECIRDINNTKHTFQCPLYKMNELITYQ